MRYQVHETQNFIGVYDTTKIARDGIVELNYMPYWIATAYTWDDNIYRQFYALCRRLNDYEKRVAAIDSLKMAAIQTKKNLDILTGAL